MLVAGPLQTPDTLELRGVRGQLADQVPLVPVPLLALDAEAVLVRQVVGPREVEVGPGSSGGLQIRGCRGRIGAKVQGQRCSGCAE